ncbi:RNA polymerase sigma factor [Rhodopseudomonas sp. HC1]|uniref:RNA polymerase sigma factor n=1 Tax=Rhodopseudomonas infernalis TaxID=2897386 RepID=UPI001EE8845C|nr:RNA polymerase sigma factor [Rhodopseudomonas infernalis]MCG6206732.1 RNA polymerase sigma factor [Rhodopseudomonas infernalis]
MSDLTDNLATLYADEHGRLKRFLMARGVSASAAADIVQEAFLRLLRTPRDEIRDLRSYLFRTTGNLAIDDVRRQQRSVLGNAVELDEALADPAPLPDAVLISREEFQALHAALAGLPPRPREVLILHKFEGMSYAEIAGRLGISKNTVMAHMVRAMFSLKASFSDPNATGELDR